MKTRIENCHQIEWVRGYLESAIKRAEMQMKDAVFMNDVYVFAGKLDAYKRMLHDINEVFEMEVNE